MKKLIVDQVSFGLAFNRDAQFHEFVPETTYLDLDTGEVLWLFGDGRKDEADELACAERVITPEQNRNRRQAIKAAPERYLLIPGRAHGKHHDILQDFLDSEWTLDQSLRQRAKDAYSGSIGRWKNGIDRDPSIIEPFERYKEAVLESSGEAFLRRFGIEVEWK